MKVDRFLLLVILAITCFVDTTEARKVHNRHFRFQLTLPDQVYEVRDTVPGTTLYYDTAAGMIIMISARKSKFRSVSDYMNCTHLQLEQELKNEYGDSTLKLISCSRSLYYPEQTSVLHFQVSVLPFDYSMYVIYFIHHRHKEIQISFAYKKANEPKSLNYINGVMRTLKLKKII